MQGTVELQHLRRRDRGKRANIMEVSLRTLTLAMVLIIKPLEFTSAKDERFDAGYDETILLQLRSKAS